MSYAPEYANSHAVVVGIGKYQRVSPLAYATNDAIAVADLLKVTFGFPAENVTLLLDEKATMSAIRAAFLALTNKGATAPDDRVVFFFAGHGHTIRGLREVGFLVPVDGSPSDRNSLIRWDELTREAELIDAKHILFLMDACYGGLALQRSSLVGGKHRFVNDMMRRRARQVLSAGKADEVVTDGNGVRPGHSIFTAYLLNALEGAAASEGGLITANAVMAWVCQRVANDQYSKQTPHYGLLDGDGDFVFDAGRDDPLASATPIDGQRDRLNERNGVTHESDVSWRIRRPFRLWASVIALLIIAAAIAGVTVWQANVRRAALAAAYKSDGTALLNVIRVYLDDLNRISKYKERGDFYGPVDLALVSEEADRWRVTAAALEARLRACDASPSECGPTLIAGITEPAPAPKPGMVITFTAAPSAFGRNADVQKSNPFGVLRGNEGYTAPLAMATMGQWTAHDAPGRTCDSIAGFLVFSTADSNFNLTDRTLNVARTQSGAVDPYRFFLFGWPPATPLNVSLYRKDSNYAFHGACSPTPALIVWQPDSRIFKAPSLKETVTVATETAEQLLSQR